MSHPRGQAQKGHGDLEGGTDLGLYMVGHIVGCASQRDLPDGPWGIIGQVGRQDTDSQLALRVQWAEESVWPGCTWTGPMNLGLEYAL